ncbi:MAG TPA: DUF58 domain-containing protein [Bdellovibrionota bacterium]|nr:DUF58 domain-containing protein [Bdellovibrionota bacterium]
MRRLQLPIAGRWYVGMLVLMGGVSLVSSNSVVYLMESLLLSGLLLSLIVSYRAAQAIRVEVRRRPIRANGENQDLIVISNRSRFPVFCIEVEEWSGKESRRLAFIPYLKGRTVTTLPARAVYGWRGEWSWDGIAVSTTYPYGFLKSVAPYKRDGKRIVWPAAAGGGAPGGSRLEGQSQSPGGSAVLEGEVRPMNYDDDVRSVVWTLSSRGGDLMVRMRASDRHLEGLTLDLRTAGGPDFETRVSALATRVYELPANDTEAVGLTLVDWEGKRHLRGRTRVLDCLATIRPLGARPGKAAG